MAKETTRDLEPRAKQSVEREGTRPGPIFQPDVDIVERPGEFYITADLPGVGEDHVRIHLEEGVLSIDAELSVQPDPSWTPVHTEYRLGGYHREFRLSQAIDVDRIQAAMSDGVLQLHLPKTEQHRPRQIVVQAG